MARAKRPLLYVLTGGGSGGHITPLLAVADRLYTEDPSATIVTIGERGSQFSHLTADRPSIHRTYRIFAGKYRRYHDETWLQRLIDIKTLLLNARDGGRLFIGFMQALVLIGRLRPDVVFLKGGFVGVPVGLAAALWRVPIVTHDSDAMPGLANRIVSRWARVHATGMPPEQYPYPPKKIVYTGVLISDDYEYVTPAIRRATRRELALPVTGQCVFITGGSLGSRRINRAVRAIVTSLLSEYPSLTVVHQVGKGNMNLYAGYQHDRLLPAEFVSGMHRYSAAADVIITRAGANTLAEFGAQAKALIVVPSPFLAGGHQLKNAQILQLADAALIVSEQAMNNNPDVLGDALRTMLANKNIRERYARTLHAVTRIGAVTALVTVLRDVAAGKDISS